MANEISIIVGAKDNTGPAVDSAERRQRKLGDTTKETGKSYEEAGKKASGFGTTLKRIGEVAAGVLAADMLQTGARRAMDFFKSSVKAASDLGESVNAVNKVFDSASEKVQNWGKENANAIGLSTRAFNQMATPLGSMLKNQGLNLDDVTKHTIKLTERAADMASVFNTDVTDALVAIQAGLRGEQDPLERYGVSLSAVAVEARALSDTHKTSTAQLTAQEKALARLNLIYDQTADTAGDFRDTADGLANSQRIATATIEEAKSKIGTAFIPVMAKAAEMTGKVAAAFTSLPQPALLATATAAGLGAALLVMAPRVVATKEALEKMAASDSLAQRSMAKTATVAARLGTVLTGVSVAALAVNAAVGDEGAQVQVDALAESLANLGRSNLMAGEGARVFGSDLSKLQYDLGTLGSGFWAQFGNGLASVVEMFGDFGQDQSLTKARERIAGIDSALAALVQRGRTQEAAAAFDFLAAQAMDAGISVDDLRAGLPQYTGAMQLAGKSTKQLGTTAAGAARDIDRLDQEIDDVINKTFSFEEAQDKAANALARLADQVKEQKKGHEKGAASLTGNTQAARDNRDAVRDLVRLYEDLMVQADEAGQSTAGFKKSLEDQLVAMGFSRDEAQRYTKQLEDVKARLDAIPKTTTITIMTDAERAIAQARETDREIRALYRNPIYVNVVTNPYSYDQGHAHGGIMGAASGGARGGMTWVGERGPELVRLPYGSTVYPAGQSQQMAGGGGGQVEAVLVSTEGISNAAAKALVKLLFPDLRAVVRGLGGPDRAFS